MDVQKIDQILSLKGKFNMTETNSIEIHKLVNRAHKVCTRAAFFFKFRTNGKFLVLLCTLPYEIGLYILGCKITMNCTTKCSWKKLKLAIIEFPAGL